MILRTIFILFGDVPSSKCSTVPRTSGFFHSFVHPFFGSSAILETVDDRCVPDERVQSDAVPIRESRAEGRGTLGGSVHACLRAGAPRGMRRGERDATPLMTKREKERRGALRGSRKRTVARPVAN